MNKTAQVLNIEYIDKLNMLELDFYLVYGFTPYQTWESGYEKLTAVQQERTNLFWLSPLTRQYQALSLVWWEIHYFLNLQDEKENSI